MYGYTKGMHEKMHYEARVEGKGVRKQSRNWGNE